MVRAKALVLIVAGSESDRPVVEKAEKVLEEAGVGYEFEVASAHRTPDRVAELARTAEEKGYRVVIAAAGLAAALPGVMAAHTRLPVIGLPVAAVGSAYASAYNEGMKAALANRALGVRGEPRSAGKTGPSGGAGKAAKATNKDKGESFEKEVKQAFGKTARKNHQGRAGGSINNPDVSALGEWEFEVKDTERLEVPKWLREAVKNTTPPNKPGLVFKLDGEPWVTIRLADRANFASDMAEAAGAEVYWP